MYAYIKGQLVSATPAHCVIEAYGVGYKIFIPPSALGKLPQVGSEVLLHCSHVVREISQALYGFLSSQERDVFEVLMSVSGIGPKLGLSIIGHLSIEELHHSIASNEINTLCRIPGIGKKTSERLIIELRDKLGAMVPPDPSGFAVNMHTDPRSQKVMDAMSALINLGYNQNIAQKAIKKSLGDLPESIDLASLITYALKNV